MKFDKLLHPEIVLGKRGDDFMRKFYREAVHTIRFRPEGGGMEINALVNMMNRSQQRSLALMQRFRLDQGKVYHVNRDFLEALSGVQRDINLKYLPERFVGYFSFAEETIYDEEDEVEGAYIYVGPSRHTMLQDSTAERVFWCAYITKGYLKVGTVCVDIKEGESVEDLISRVNLDDSIGNQTDEDGLSKRARVFNTVLNCVMYVHSSEPDVRRVPPADSLTNRQIAQVRERTGIKNGCSVHLTFLNWTYAKQRVYSTDSTWVNSFPRWQPCGPGLSQVKLIWVKEHPRHFKKSVDLVAHRE